MREKIKDKVSVLDWDLLRSAKAYKGGVKQ